MPDMRHTQHSLAAGELQPDAWGREDIGPFYNSARVIENIVALPQGRWGRRPGLKFSYPQRGTLTQVDTTISGTWTATNGGTASNIDDGDEATALLTTTNVSTTDDYVVAHLDFGSAQEVDIVDFAGLQFTSLPSDMASETMELQYSSDDATWSVAATINVGITAYDRRIAAAPDTHLFNARYMRLVRAGTDDLSTAKVQFLECYVWTEASQSDSGATVGAFSEHEIATEAGAQFKILLTALNADIFNAVTGAFVAAIKIPHTESQVAAVNSTADLDTLVLFHEDVHPFILQRLDDDGDWRGGNYAFDTIVAFPFDDATQYPAQNEVQLVDFASMSGGDEYVIEFAGERTDTITWSSTSSNNVTRINNAIESLPQFSSVTVTDKGSNDFEYEFDGDDAGRSIAVLVFDLATGNGNANVTRMQNGKPAADDLWSADRGYPKCGAFHQGRLWLGGFKARPGPLAGSRSGDVFDFREELDPVATSPIVVEPRVDEEVTVERLVSGRHLQMFTSAGEFYTPTEPITPDNVAFKNTSRHGITPNTRTADVQGGTVFVDESGTAIREYLFEDNEQSYSAEPVSLLAGHLVSNPISMALRRALNAWTPTVLMVANTGMDEAGATVPAAQVVIDRVQSVSAFLRMTTRLGTFKAFIATRSGEASALVNRSLAGNAWNYLEIFDPDCLNDCSTFIDNPDIEDFTATADQTVFTYTFTSPTAADDVLVMFQEADGYRPVNAADYTLDLSAKTVTFAAGRSLGDAIRILPRMASLDLSGVAERFEGIEVQVNNDGKSLGRFTPSSNTIDLGDARVDQQAEVGLYMVPYLELHPPKGKGETSPTMRKMRIWRALVSFYRTATCTIGIGGNAQRTIPLHRFGAGNDVDVIAEDLNYTGVKRVSGLKGWFLEPTLVLTQSEPGPWAIRFVTYDTRY